MNFSEASPSRYSGIVSLSITYPCEDSSSVEDEERVGPPQAENAVNAAVKNSTAEYLLFFMSLLLSKIVKVFRSPRPKLRGIFYKFIISLIPSIVNMKFLSYLKISKIYFPFCPDLSSESVNF